MTKKNINIEEVKTLTMQGISDEKIAQTLGTNRKIIQDLRHSNNLPSGRTILMNRKKEQIEKMLSQGISGGEISRTLHVSPATIATFKKENSIKSAFDMKMSEEDINKAMEMAKKGMLDNEIAKEFGVTSGNIGALRRKRKIATPFSYERFSKTNKKDFEKLFYMGWSDKDIAEQLGWTENGIYQYRQRHGYKRESKREAKDNPLTKDNMEIILGIMMGDGSMECNYKNARLNLAHCEKQKEYTFYIADKLSNLNPHTRHSVSKIDERTGKCYDSYWCSFPANPSFNDICNHFYVGRVKRIPIELFDNFTWQSLAYMFMDDGCKNHCGASIATNCFSIEDLHKFQGFLKGKFNLDTTVNKEHALYINAESFRRMIPNIEPYMCECMKYKIRE